MKNNVGNPKQTRGAEHYTLHGGKGEGMNFLYVRNGLGLEVWLSVDRCGDISRLSFKGDNMGYFSPCGYVSPQYYDGVGAGFLKSFTAGFLTTCGLTAVGPACEDAGEALPQHGTIANTPAELVSIDETEQSLTIKLKVTDAVIFGRKLVLHRTYVFSYTENSVELIDETVNMGDTASPYMILYHCNMGYPLLSENSVVRVPHNKIEARADNAKANIDTALVMENPQAEYIERCYFYDIAETGGKAKVGIYNKDIEKGVVFSYDKAELPCFTEWKMMGKTDYVLGLEPGNCEPQQRNILREKGGLEFIQPDESRRTAVKFSFTEKDFEAEF